MPNTTSAKKALRQSKSKRTDNLYWKRRVRNSQKNIVKQLKDKTANIDIIRKEEALLYKTVDKAAKVKAIHRNKARRIKSKISRQISAHEQSKEATKQTTKKATKEGKKAKSKSKSS